MESVSSTDTAVKAYVSINDTAAKSGGVSSSLSRGQAWTHLVPVLSRERSSPCAPRYPARRSVDHTRSHPLAEHLADALRHAAVDLSLHDRLVQHIADVVDRGI